MKFQLVILSALLVSAFALPVPDEEVSPVAQAAPQVLEKSAESAKPEEKIIEPVKPVEARAAEEPAATLLAATTEEKKEEKPAKAELPASAPDAEIKQTLPELKEEKKDKQTRADDVVEEAKALPVVNAPVAAVEEQKQVAEEAKPVTIVEPQTNAEGKSAAVAEIVPSEQKKDELSAAEETPIVKSDVTPATEIKKEEAPARQERVGEAVNEVDAKVAPSVAAVDVVPEVKNLKTEESAAPAEQSIQAEKAIESKDQLKATETAEKKLEPAPQAPAGDIPQQIAEESSIKAVKAEPELPAAEAKKIEEPVVAAVAAEVPVEKPQDQQKELKPEVKESEPKTLEEKKPAEEQKLSENKKSEESKDSSSSESKESGESKEDKSKEDKSN